LNVARINIITIFAYTIIKTYNMTTQKECKYEARIAEIIDVKMNQPNLSEKHLDKLNSELNRLYKYVDSTTRKHYQQYDTI
jgi:hypothetical protein